MERVFVDTGAWYALVDQADADHEAARGWFEANRPPLVTTDYALHETIALLRVELGHAPAATFGEQLRGSRLARLVTVRPDDHEAAWAIFKKCDDQVLSFTDCRSFAVMKRLGLRRAFTVDSDFRTMGFVKVI